MNNIEQVRWSELREVWGGGYVWVQMVGDLSSEGWKFAEKEACESVWYPAKPTEELEAKAIAELNKLRHAQ